MKPDRRVNFGHVFSDFVDRARALEAIQEMTADGSPHLVVTPNIAHVWQAETEPALRQAYAAADLATPDGWPLVLAMRWLTRRWRGVERVTGADLLPLLSRLPLDVSLVGGRGDAAELAASVIRAERRPNQKVWVESAPSAELLDPKLRGDLIDRIAEQQADLIFIGLGVPKQEEFALDLLSRLDHGVVLCVGAAIDFMGGVVERAPRWMRTAHVEWLHRLFIDPKRMWHRYSRSAPHFIRAVLRERRRVNRAELLE